MLRDAVLPVGRKPLPVVTQKLERLGLELYEDALLRMARGTAQFRPQPPGHRPLYRDPRGADLARFWLRYLARLCLPRTASRSARS